MLTLLIPVLQRSGSHYTLLQTRRDRFSKPRGGTSGTTPAAPGNQVKDTADRGPGNWVKIPLRMTKLSDFLPGN